MMQCFYTLRMFLFLTVTLTGRSHFTDTAKYFFSMCLQTQHHAYTQVIFFFCFFYLIIIICFGNLIVYRSSFCLWKKHSMEVFVQRAKQYATFKIRKHVSKNVFKEYQTLCNGCHGYMIWN